jgi:hypothetical protein
MLNIKNIILFVLIGTSIFLLIKMYSHTTQIIENTKNFITENIEEQFDDISEKIQIFEEKLDNKLNVFGKKINEIYSVHNKINKLNEIAKMNSQNIINQLNQYDEEAYLAVDEEVDKNCVYNSIDNMEYSPQKDKSSNCFVKTKNNNIKDLFYMSPQKSSKTSSCKSNKESISSKSTSQSKNSLVLELENNYFKTNINNNSPKSKDIQKILDDTSNAFSRNNSFNDLLNINKNKLFSENISTENVSKNNEDIEINDPPIVLVPDVINNLINKKVIEII